MDDEPCITAQTIRDEIKRLRETNVPRMGYGHYYMMGKWYRVPSPEYTAAVKELGQALHDEIWPNE